MSEAYKRGRADADKPDSWIFSCPYCASKQPAEYADWVKGFRERRVEQSAAYKAAR